MIYGDESEMGACGKRVLRWRNILVAVGALGLCREERSARVRAQRKGERQTYTLDIGLNHLLDELVEGDLPLPSENALGLGGSSVKELDLGGTLCEEVSTEDEAETKQKRRTK